MAWAKPVGRAPTIWGRANISETPPGAAQKLPAHWVDAQGGVVDAPASGATARRRPSASGGRQPEEIKNDNKK